MKRAFVSLVALVLIPVVAFATTLPDYQNGKLIMSQSCDAGKTTVRTYTGPNENNEKWAADEYRTAAGDVFVEFYSSYENDGFHMKLAGSTEMKQVPHKEWDTALKAKSLNTFNYIHGGAHDCK